jgi:hypothetical protein
MGIDLLYEIGPAIAEHLPGWKYVFDEDFRAGYFIQGAKRKRGELAICLHVDHKKRLNISGAWPYAEGQPLTSPRDIYIDGKYQESPSISVSMGRPPEKLAADILRRFIPEYLRLYNLCLERLQANELAEKQQFTVAQDFAKIMGDKTTNAHASWYGEDCYGHVDVNSGGDTATLELRGNVAILKAALVAAGKAGAFKK